MSNDEPTISLRIIFELIPLVADVEVAGVLILFELTFFEPIIFFAVVEESPYFCQGSCLGSISLRRTSSQLHS